MEDYYFTYYVLNWNLCLSGILCAILIKLTGQFPNELSWPIYLVVMIVLAILALNGLSLRSCIASHTQKWKKKHQK